MKILFKKSNIITDGKPKLPLPSDLEYGELAINYGKGGETFSIKNSNNEIVVLRFDAAGNLTKLFEEHINNIDNPHSVTKEQIGLGNVDNTSDADKPIKSSVQLLLDKLLNYSDIYNSTENDTLKDLTTLVWSAAQGYAMNNIIIAYMTQDTSKLEQRIKNCEDNV